MGGSDHRGAGIYPLLQRHEESDAPGGAPGKDREEGGAGSHRKGGPEPGYPDSGRADERAGCGWSGGYQKAAGVLEAAGEAGDSGVTYDGGYPAAVRRGISDGEGEAEGGVERISSLTIGSNPVFRV